MDIAEVGALAGAVLAGMALVGLVFNAGRHAQRLDRAEDDLKDLKIKVEEHGAAISAWDQALQLLNEVRGDVKRLLTGEIELPSRGRGRRADID